MTADPQPTGGCGSSHGRRSGAASCRPQLTPSGGQGHATATSRRQLVYRPAPQPWAEPGDRAPWEGGALLPWEGSPLACRLPGLGPAPFTCWRGPQVDQVLRSGPKARVMCGILRRHFTCRLCGGEALPTPGLVPGQDIAVSGAWHSRTQAPRSATPLGISTWRPPYRGPFSQGLCQVPQPDPLTRGLEGTSAA